MSGKRDVSSLSYPAVGMRCFINKNSWFVCSDLTGGELDDSGELVGIEAGSAN